MEKNNKPKVIAFYLPQYHPFKENDEWWGKGFTEWTNVGRAKPLYHNHYQPKIPTELGYYDLRLPLIREQQAQMAKDAGVYGFCYWHYWFGDGKQLMSSIFDEVRDSGSPDFPFMLGWANHSWFAKNWNTKDTKGKDRLLIEQKYLGVEDYRKHYEYALKAFKDHRYIKDGNKPMFLIFRPIDVPEEFISLWNKWAKEDGFDGIHFIAELNVNVDAEAYLNQGYSSVYYKRADATIINLYKNKKKNICTILWNKIKRSCLGLPEYIIDYTKLSEVLVDSNQDSLETVIPGLIPNFDHSPRSGKFGMILENSTPEAFYDMCKKVFALVEQKENKFVILRSWNEWGEGNYMEPDLKYGRGYLEALYKALNNK